MSDKNGELFCYDESEQPYTITASFMDRFSNTSNFAEVFGLYGFYYKTARWQKINQVYATIPFTMKGTGLSREKIIKIRNQLVRLGAIKKIKKRDSKGHFQQYTKVMFGWEEIAPSKEPHLHLDEKTVSISGSGACELQTKIQPLSKRTISPKEQSSQEVTPPSPKSDKPKKPSNYKLSKRYLPQAKRLAEIVMSNRNIKISDLQIRKWCVPIRELAVDQHIHTGRMNELLNWYANHIGEQYVNVIQSGEAFKKKFLDLEANIENWGKTRQGNRPSYIRDEKPMKERNDQYTVKGIFDVDK